MFDMYTDLALELKNLLELPEGYSSQALDMLSAVQSRYLKDTKVNIKNAFVSEHLSTKEVGLTGLALAINDKNTAMIPFFKGMCSDADANQQEMAEAVACASLLASNNITYRFRHFMNEERYHKAPMRIKMNVMMRPEMGKALFELISLAVSAVNGCEMCVLAHEKSLVEMGTHKERIWDVVRLAGVYTSVSKLIY